MLRRTLQPSFEYTRHVAYLRACLCRHLPSSMAGLDSNRLTLAYFCCSGLDLLGELTEEEKLRTLTWVKKLEIVGRTTGGFRGSPFFICSGGECCNGVQESQDLGMTWDKSHIAMTYTALGLCLICQGNLDGINKAGVSALVRDLQKVKTHIWAMLLHLKHLRCRSCIHIHLHSSKCRHANNSL